MRPFDPIGEPVKVSKGAGGAPMWSKDGKELFYRKPDSWMIAVTFTTEPAFRVRERTPLFQNDYDADPGGHQHYDVAADGRFLMIEHLYFPPDRMHVVANAITRAPPR